MSWELSQRILTKLSDLSSNTTNEPCIFKVHDSLRSNNKEAYEPKVLSIGPYHHGKPNLKKMEMHKLRYLQELLDRTGEISPYTYITALTELEDRARKCYAEDISLISKDDFVEMMLLDGCFIIEFLRKLYDPKLRNSDDTIFQMNWLLRCITTDLILFENQVPFSILNQLFDMTKLLGQEEKLKHLVFHLVENLISDYGPICSYPEISAAHKAIHILDLVHKILCSSFAATLAETNSQALNDFSAVEFIRSTSELQQSGIQFEKAASVQNQSWLDITFENGKIKIPTFEVVDATESVFRNLIAYEEYMLNSQTWRCVSDYTTFLDLLIDSPRDVEKLRHHHIICNWLGDDEAVSTMFNKLGNDVTVNDLHFCYSKVFKEVNKYSRKRRNVWKAHLMRNYFNNPWSIISFLAAFVLLILTFVQTIFSILQYANQ